MTKNFSGVCCAVRNYFKHQLGIDDASKHIITLPDGTRSVEILSELPDHFVTSLCNAGATITRYSRFKHGVGVIHSTKIEIRKDD